MNRNILVLVISLLLCSSVYGQSLKESFRVALDARDMVKAEEILKAWDLRDANDSELYVAYFNFFTVKSINNMTGDYDKEYSQKALDYITEGVERFPTRLDMRIAKIYMLDQLKDYKSFTSEVLKLIVQSDKIKNNWKGEDFSLIDRADEMLFGAIVEFQGLLFDKSDTALYKDIIQISEEMQKYYPRNTQCLLSLSTVYITQKEYDKSLETLLKAEKIEPGNSILLYNIAYVYGVKGDKSNAKKYYELTIANIKEQEEPLRDAAQKQLDLLK